VINSYSEYKNYICDSLNGIVKESTVNDIRDRIGKGIDSVDELYTTYRDLYLLKNKEDLMSYKVWLREKRLSKLLD